MSGKLTAIQKNEKLKKRLQQQLEKLVVQEKTVVARWKKAYHYSMKVTSQLEKKRHSNSKKVERMWATVIALAGGKRSFDASARQFAGSD